ncbi:MAG: aspartate/glutamate racemase family protein [Rhizobiales bacterium]|nr:aspartate/glutamate racemase family protein [Hyphomicrobiales bacterium]
MSEARPVIGLLMLETRFPRIPGDIGHPETFAARVIPRVVEGADVATIIRARGGATLGAFCAAARALVAEGAQGVITSCGFLSLFQRDIAAACGAPVAASSLMQAPLVERTLPAGKRVGIVTIDATALSADHLAAAGAATDAPVEGVERGRELHRVVMNDETSLDAERACADVVEAALRLAARGDVGAILLECTNMGPYARAVAQATGLPVYDVVTLVDWFSASLAPRRF